LLVLSGSHSSSPTAATRSGAPRLARGRRTWEPGRRAPRAPHGPGALGKRALQAAPRHARRLTWRPDHRRARAAGAQALGGHALRAAPDRARRLGRQLAAGGERALQQAALALQVAADGGGADREGCSRRARRRRPGALKQLHLVAVHERLARAARVLVVHLRRGRAPAWHPARPDQTRRAGCARACASHRGDDERARDVTRVHKCLLERCPATLALPAQTQTNRS